MKSTADVIYETSLLPLHLLHLAHQRLRVRLRVDSHRSRFSRCRDGRRGGGRCCGRGLSLLVGDDLEHVSHADEAALLGRVPRRDGLLLGRDGRERLRLLLLLLVVVVLGLREELVVLRRRRQDVVPRLGRRRELVLLGAAVGILLLLLVLLLRLRGHGQVAGGRPAEVGLHLDAELLLQPLVERGSLRAGGGGMVRWGRQVGAAAPAVVLLVWDSAVVGRCAVRMVVAA